MYSLIICLLCVFTCVCAMAHTLRPQDSLGESVLSFYYVGVEVIRLGGGDHLYLLGHLTVCTLNLSLSLSFSTRALHVLERAVLLRYSPRILLFLLFRLYFILYFILV